LSKEDLAQYDAIRILSDLKENPSSTPEQIQHAERHLNDVNMNMKFVSEAALLSRMNWWTAEYGLIGTVYAPKIFGAGLLSSVGEATACLDPKVKKIPLSVACVDFTYDITEPQPQLFVAQDFAQLGDVLEDLSGRLAFRRGGVFGLERAIEAETVTTVQLNSEIQISGLLKDYLESDDSSRAPIYLQFAGPCQLALAYAELPGQGPAQHAQGYSTPIGMLKNHRRCLSTYTPPDLANMAITRDRRSRLVFESGVTVEGIPTNWIYESGHLILISWKDCRVTLGDRVLFDPSWGVYDMAVGSAVTSVFGGPADRAKYGETDSFKAAVIPLKSFSQVTQRNHAFYQKIRTMRESGTASRENFAALVKEFFTRETRDWLQALELIEISHQIGLGDADREQLLNAIDQFTSPAQHQCVKDGLALAARAL
jgi:phenylalanine-4-hydroxylase